MEDGIENADSGYSCVEEMVTLTDESVTTIEDHGFVQGTLSYSESINAETIFVTFNGVEYTCSRRPAGSMGFEYGALYDTETDTFDWSQYPFNIASIKRQGVLDTFLFTETAGTYSIKIEAINESVETTECFEKAVRKVADTGFTCTTTEEATLLTEGSVTTEATPPAATGQINYDQLIDADTIRVTLNGAEYIYEKHETDNTALYGSVNETAEPPRPDLTFSEYPFVIMSAPLPAAGGGIVIMNQIATKSAGTHQLKIEEYVETTTVETTKCFKKAVEAVTTQPFIVHAVERTQIDGIMYLVTDATWQQVHDAIEEGRQCYFDFPLPTEQRMCHGDWANFEIAPKGMLPIISAWRVGSENSTHYIDIASSTEFNSDRGTTQAITSVGLVELHEARDGALAFSAECGSSIE